MAPTVGIIANPASARDIRRVVASATGLQIADRANIVLRVLAALASCGIEQVLIMPETGGIRGHVVRGVERSHNQGEKRYPRVTFLDIPVTGTVEDTKLAGRLMRHRRHDCAGTGTRHVQMGGRCQTMSSAGKARYMFPRVEFGITLLAEIRTSGGQATLRSSRRRAQRRAALRVGR